MLRVLAGRLVKCTSGLNTDLSRGAKQSTLLKGLDVDPNADSNVPVMLRQLLHRARTRLPSEAIYREHVEAYCSRFLKILEDAPSQAEAEQILGRQLEEVQVDIAKEMQLVDLMAQWQPWSTDSERGPQMFAGLSDIPENVRQFRKFQHALGSNH